MFHLTYFICAFVLCISCTLCWSAPPATLLSALLSPSAAVSVPASAASHDKRETGLTTYDQKQSGKYNIHLNIKDVAIIALDAGGVDGGIGDFGEDYYEDYDLSDFTVKPMLGLIEITSDKPSSSTTPPSLIQLDDSLAVNATSTNETENASNSPIEEPILKDPVNKTQSVVILNENSTNLNSGPTSTTSGIVVSTSTPASEDLPPKLTLTDLANIQSAQKPSSLAALFQTKPNEIPVQIILDSLPSNQQNSRQRPNGNWRLRNRVRATPSHNRRITPPHLDDEHSQHSVSAAAIGNNKYRKNSLGHVKPLRRNCVFNQNGQCQNNQRRFSSPTLNGILSLLSFLSPKAIEQLE